MFGKDKVKGHNRVIKSKSGFKVTRIGDFLRKKDDNTKRNLAIGVGTASILGVGTALLLKKKGIKFPGQVAKKQSLAKVTKRASSEVNENVVVPKNTPPVSPSEKAIKELDVLPSTSKPKISKQVENVIEDSWATPIKTKINTSSEMLVKPKSEEIKLLTTPLTSKTRSNLLRTKGITTKDRVISRLVNGYATLPLPMKLTLQMEKALSKPRRVSSVGRPPDTKGLKAILDDTDKSDLDLVISKAKRKVEDRLKRESKIANNVKKN